MPRVLAAVVLLGLPVVGVADEHAVALKVRPAAAPKPALKYQLLPTVSQMNPGNPAQWYVRSFAEQRTFFFDKNSVAARKRGLTVPLADLPKEKLDYYHNSALRQADWAARLDALDWQVLHRVQSEGLEGPHPELATLNALAEALHVRFRLDIQAGKFHDCVRSAKTMLAFARHLGEYPAEEATALGLSVANRVCDALEEMIQQPGCPNLYWALADLPSPVVELRKGFQGTVARVATELAIPDGEIMTDEQVEKVVARLSGVLGVRREKEGDAPRGLRAGLRAALADEKAVTAARKRLHEPGAPGDPLRGLAALPVAKFSPTHVILLDAKREFERQRDDELKWLAVPHWQDEPESGRGDALFADFLPRVAEMRRAQGRVEQRFALLRHVEALRMYAAAHDGRFPASLGEVGVPLPNDPFTGKPFAYSFEGTTAHVRGTPPKAEAKNPEFNRQYKIVVTK